MSASAIRFDGSVTSHGVLVGSWWGRGLLESFQKQVEKATSLPTASLKGVSLTSFFLSPPHTPSRLSRGADLH